MALKLNQLNVGGIYLIDKCDFFKDLFYGRTNRTPKSIYFVCVER